MANINFSEPILAKNPVNGKHINLAPLFYQSFQLTDKGEPSLKVIKKKIDEAIRLISTSRFEESSTDDYGKELTAYLYGISDMFEEMENF